MKLGRAAAMRSMATGLFTFMDIRLSPTLRLRAAIDEIASSLPNWTSLNNKIACLRGSDSRNPRVRAYPTNLDNRFALRLATHPLVPPRGLGRARKQE
jgi:hypothetical protein